MSYKNPAPKSREQLEQSLFSARHAAKWSLRIAVIGAIAGILGVIGVLYIPNSLSLFANLAGFLVVVGMNGSVMSLLVYSGNKHSAARTELEIQELTKRNFADQIAQGNKNRDLETGELPGNYWLENRVRPQPQPYGVSDEGAEHLTAQWLQYLGFEDASVTQYSGDGGIDVETFDYVCQVKNYRDKAVSVTEVRELFGVAASERKRAILFTSSGATTQAIQFADRNGIALIRFDARSARLEEINDDGSDLLVNGEYEEA